MLWKTFLLLPSLVVHTPLNILEYLQNNIKIHLIASLVASNFQENLDTSLVQKVPTASFFAQLAKYALKIIY